MQSEQAVDLEKLNLVKLGCGGLATATAAEKFLIQKWSEMTLNVILSLQMFCWSCCAKRDFYTIQRPPPPQKKLTRNESKYTFA